MIKKGIQSRQTFTLLTDKKPTSICIAAASGSSIPKEFLKLMILSASSPLSSTSPGGSKDDTKLNENLKCKLIIRAIIGQHNTHA